MSQYFQVVGPFILGLGSVNDITPATAKLSDIRLFSYRMRLLMTSLFVLLDSICHFLFVCPLILEEMFSSDVNILNVDTNTK